MKYKDIIEYCKEYKRQIIGWLLIAPLIISIIYVIYLISPFFLLLVVVFMMAGIGKAFLDD